MDKTLKPPVSTDLSRSAPDDTAVALGLSDSIIEKLAELTDFAYFRVDADRRLTHWSAGAERITGFTEQDVLGMPCVVGLRCQACLVGCGVFDQGDVRRMPLVLHRKDGSSIHVRKSGRTLLSPEGEVIGAVEVMVPVDARSVDSDYHDPRLDRLFRALGRYGVLVNHEFRIVQVSGDLADRVGVSPAELVGTAVRDLFGEALFGEESAFRQAITEGHRREGWRAVLRTTDGSEVPVSLSAGPLDAPEGGDGQAFIMVRPDELGVDDCDIPRFEGMVARSAVMQRIFRLIELIHDNDATVLITGESGTGKELVARALHARSHRASGPFVAVNCGALPADLLESELFGHVRGAFTGAVRDRPGRFEVADGGTLFLDEVGDLPLPLQVKLLRVLQDRSFERVGDSHARKVDVRVLAATNMDLMRAVAERRFRDDLFYRLRVVPIEIPPLRQRREDLELLIRYLLRRIGRRRGRSLRLSPTAARRLLRYDWPGNVRELENALEFATAVCEGQTVHLGDLPAELGTEDVAGGGAPAEDEAIPLAPIREQVDPARSGRSGGQWAQGLTQREQVEARRIRLVLEQTHYRRSEAAEMLGMSRTTLWRKMRMYRLG